MFIHETRENIFILLKKRNSYKKQINQAKPHMNIGIANINLSF